MRKWTGYMKGVNLGGWLSQFPDAVEMAEKRDADGNASDELPESLLKHIDTFITGDDFKRVKDMGCDHVRIPVDYVLLENEAGDPRDIGFKKLHEAVSFCRENGLNMIIDLHETYGYSFDPLKTWVDRKKFFYDDALQARFLKLWQRIVREFLDDTDIVAFELLNEIVLTDVYDAWNDVIDKAVAAIREVSEDCWIVYGGVVYNNVTSVKLLRKPADDHIVFNFHCYDPMIFTHQAAYWVDDMTPDFRKTYHDTIGHYKEVSESLGKRYSEAAERAYLEGNPDNFLGKGDSLTPDSQMGPDFYRIIFKEALDAAARFDAPLYCGEYGVIDKADPRDAVEYIKDINTVFEESGIGRAYWNYRGKDFGIVDGYLGSYAEEFYKYL
ncbi:MAG: cellulase family glycosylhydrolase [Lachnospiraceae bacterium]|nr:cellulase family glycosylhydrolase [Lachnospiraceae bacterium]